MRQSDICLDVEAGGLRDVVADHRTEEHRHTRAEDQRRREMATDCELTSCSDAADGCLTEPDERDGLPLGSSAWTP